MNHRYILRRSWMGSGQVNWIMLNPSTADDVFDDPTIRKCIGFTKRWGYGSLVVTNLFAFRATEPREMKALAKLDYSRAVGYGNDQDIISAASESDLVVVAWGTHGSFLGRAQTVIKQVIPDITLYCIGLTKEGFPLHPCMAAYTDAPLIYAKGE